MSTPSMWFLIAEFVLLTSVALLYLKLAGKLGIVDKPNTRSSHRGIIIRGGGVIFYFSVLIYELIFHFPHPYFFAGLSVIAMVSFIDDIRSMPSWIRASVHLIAVILIITELNIWGLSWWWLLSVIIVTIGSLNAFNFMDGINGMTGIYGLVCVISLWFINNELVYFLPTDFFIALIIGIVVFGFFNFRSNALWFAGDVGSISLAFMVIYMVLTLLIASQDPSLILLLAVYGVDTVLTIIHRILRNENIFKAHRLHLYQYFANQRKIPHMSVALTYGLVQLLINCVVIGNLIYAKMGSIQLMSIVFVLLTLFYVVLKWWIGNHLNIKNVKS